MLWAIHTQLGRFLCWNCLWCACYETYRIVLCKGAKRMTKSYRVLLLIHTGFMSPDGMSDLQKKKNSTATYWHGQRCFHTQGLLLCPTHCLWYGTNGSERITNISFSQRWSWMWKSRNRYEWPSSGVSTFAANFFAASPPFENPVPGQTEKRLMKFIQTATFTFRYVEQMQKNEHNCGVVINSTEKLGWTKDTSLCMLTVSNVLWIECLGFSEVFEWTPRRAS